MPTLDRAGPARQGSAAPPPVSSRALRRRSLAALLRGLSLCLTCLAAPSCLSAPDPQSLLDVGFRSPEQTFESFKTAVRGDLPMLEYRCLSAEFRRANGLSAHTFLEGRKQLLQQNPFIRWVARAEIVSSEPLGERRHYIEAVVKAFVTSRRLGIRLVRDDAVEIYGGQPENRGQLLFDDYVEFDDVVRIVEQDDGTWELRARERFTPYTPDADPSRVGEVRFLQDWKIDAFEVLEDQDSNTAPPTP